MDAAPMSQAPVSSSGTPTPTPGASTPAPSDSAPAVDYQSGSQQGPCAGKWQKCGTDENPSEKTCCDSGFTCKRINKWHHQCEEGQSESQSYQNPSPSQATAEQQRPSPPAPTPAPAPASMASSPAAASSPVFSGSNSVWESYDGKIWRDGQEFTVRGASWFGFESPAIDDSLAMFPLGLWANDVDYHLEFIKANSNINVLRLPLAMDKWLADTPINYEAAATEPELANASYREAVDFILNKCQEHGLYVMLDLHVIQVKAGLAGQFTNGAVPPTAINEFWTQAATRYCSHPAVMAFDLLNEPHKCTWGDGNPLSDFRLKAVELGNLILDICPDNVLIVVEGIDGKASVPSVPSGEAAFGWGSYLTPVNSADMCVVLSNPSGVRCIS